MFKLSHYPTLLAALLVIIAAQTAHAQEITDPQARQGFITQMLARYYDPHAAIGSGVEGTVRISILTIGGKSGSDSSTGAGGTIAVIDSHSFPVRFLPTHPQGVQLISDSTWLIESFRNKVEGPRDAAYNFEALAKQAMKTWLMMRQELPNDTAVLRVIRDTAGSGYTLVERRRNRSATFERHLSADYLMLQNLQIDHDGFGFNTIAEFIPSDQGVLLRRMRRIGVLSWYEITVDYVLVDGLQLPRRLEFSGGRDKQTLYRGLLTFSDYRSLD
jgi:hypothetical protein